MVAMVAAATAAQASDTTRAAREAFTACLRTYVNRSIEGGMTQATFDTEYPQQCTAQQQAFRDAVISRETALRATRANAQDQANLEIEDARVNFSERFVPAQAGQAQAQAQAPAAAAPEAQAAAQPEAQAAAQAPAQPQ
ncbi:MAG TPA: hypothetical protein VN231_04450 [Allosphingosinicella sp.]|nr:hypothetical protein [Allosphingosinicella sp.]